MLGLLVIAMATLLVNMSQAALLDPMTIMKDDISRIKVMMETVGERMERFNDLYLNKLETRLLSSATSLAHIDSNVKNLQERAHVWDTFQLHVSAWNEQIKTLDKKLDILSRGAEKWEIINEKMATLMPLDDRLTKLMRKIEDMDSKVAEIQRRVNSPGGSGGLSISSAGEAPLFSEYTSRGVLSALKDIEIKVNKIAISDNSVGANQERSVLINGRKEELEMQKKTFDVVNDMAGKVDFILDKMTVGKRQNGGKQQMAQSMEDDSEDVYDDGDSDYPSGPANVDNGGSSAGINQAERSFVKQWRRMLQPVRRANQRFSSLDKVLGQLDKMANASSVTIRRDSEIKELKGDVTALLECCRGNDVGLRGLTKSVEALGEAVRSGQTNENQCVSEADLQTRLKHFQSELIRQLGDSFKEQMTSGVDRIRQTCIGQRKKSLAIHNNANGTQLSDEESTTEGAIASQGQATPVGPDTGKRDAMRNPSTPGVKMTAQSQPSFSAHVGQSGKIGVRGCHDLRLAGETETRVYSLASGKELNEGGRDYNTRYCDMTTDGGGWTVIQRRGDYGLPRENFSVNWRDYKLGFGQLDREFWFGNDFIHRLTNENDVVLRVELWDFEDGHVYADYESFRVDSEEDLYRLWVEGYQGNATDSLGSHNGYAFSTFDRDNDEAPPCCPCAPAYGGGWWFYSCFEANLNGGGVELKIRPRDFPRILRLLPQVTTPTATTLLPPYLGIDEIIPEDP